MPLEKSSSKAATERNFHEFRHGKTYRKTRKNHGKETARRQMIAAVLENKRRAAARKKTHKRKPYRKHHRAR
jgi:hypothetical protein